MGLIGMHLDLSHSNEMHEDRLLANDMREHGEIPENHFWQTVYHDYYLNDIAETGNDLRFRSHHLWVDDEFRRYDRELRRREHHPVATTYHFTAPTLAPSPDLPLSLPSFPLGSQTTAGHPAPTSQPAISGGVPEPSGLVLIGVGLVGVWVAGRWPNGGRVRGNSGRQSAR